AAAPPGSAPARPASHAAAAAPAPAAATPAALAPAAPAVPAAPAAIEAQHGGAELAPPGAADQLVAPKTRGAPGRRGHAAIKRRGATPVIDYSARPSEPPPPSLVAQAEEDPAIGRARTAYSEGNQRLFLGDSEGAIRAYRQSLELYPGYVGGYRGLGLAYSQRGDRPSALAAFRAYVAAVPNARDVALIRKRIAQLQRR
ncbi:MAG TPA: tetratricopeptide repeat protein, partial [Kofleriaceae bacterium]|nr:tetratricopeptide repeat protein [Kofleriaceae bacterium]